MNVRGWWLVYCAHQREECAREALFAFCDFVEMLAGGYFPQACSLGASFSSLYDSACWWDRMIEVEENP